MNAARSFVRARTIVLAFLVLLICADDYSLAVRPSRESVHADDLVQSSRSSSVETVQFHSTLCGKTLPYSVVLPAGYRASRVTRYPVLYLLHGLTGHYSDWLTRTNVADYASKYRIILVMPEGNDGWYTDSATVPGDKYESYFIKELIPDVQKRYRTIESRYGRGVAGLSMGGYGALKFGFKYPATFAFAGSMSGAFDAASWPEKTLLASLRESVMRVFGSDGSETRRANDLFEIVRRASPAQIAAFPYFYFDCGTEDPVCGSNPPFAALLREKKVPHEYRQMPGNHNWQYWDQQVREVLRIAAEKLRAQRASRAESSHGNFARAFSSDVMAGPRGYAVP